MSVNFSAEAGFGVRVQADKVDWSDKVYKSLRKYVWDNTSDSTRKYYGNKKSMFSEENFEMETFMNAFPDLVFSWCGDPYSTHNRGANQWFAVAKNTFIEIDDVANYVDLSKKSHVSAASAQQLELLRIISLDNENPRWFMWLNVS